MRTTTQIGERVTDDEQTLVDEAVADEAAADEAAADETVVTRSALRQRLPFLVLGLVAAVVLVSGLFAWWQAAGDDDLDRAETRDAVLIAATEHIETLQSLDYRTVDKDLDSWLAATTGSLRDSLEAVSDEERRLLSDPKKISTGQVVEAAVLDVDDTSATVIAAVEITVGDDPSAGTEPVVKRNRFSAELTKVKGEWKLENIQQVAVDLS
jgi:Mce-associated membrane protein